MILFDATPLQSEHRQRGVGAYVRHLIREIEAQGADQAHYLATLQDRRLIADLLPPERTLFLPRPHKPAQVYWLYNEIVLRTAFAALRPSAFLATDFNGTVRNPFGRTVAVLHDLTAMKLMGSKSPPASPSQRLSDWRWHVYTRKLRTVDHILTISESVKQDALELLRLTPERLTVVYHGVDHDRFLPMAGNGPYARHPPYLLSVGARGENKNQARILEAYARIAPRHPDLQMYFVGPWRRPDLSWLEETARHHDLPERVRHLGFLPDDDLASLYANARAFVFPSLEEGFGLPVLEAMASGTPVITSDRGAMREVASEAALLVDPASTDEIAAAMDGLIANTGLRHDLVSRGLDRAADFTWERTARETLALLT